MGRQYLRISRLPTKFLLCRVLQIGTTMKTLALATIMLCILSPVNAETDTNYRVLTEDFRPFAYPNEDGTIDGMAYDIVSWLLKDLKIETEIEMVPWNRAISLTRQKKNHVLFSVARTKERENWFKWVGPFYSDDVIFYQRSDMTPTDKETLKNQGTILVSHGYPEETILVQQGYKELIFTDNTAISLQMLLKRRANYFPMGKAAMPCLLFENNVHVDQLKPTDIVLHTSHLYLALSPSTPDSEVLRWQYALDKIKSTSRYQSIINNYRYCQK